jgi:hypothetical protein
MRESADASCREVKHTAGLFIKLSEGCYGLREGCYGAIHVWPFDVQASFSLAAFPA